MASAIFLTSLSPGTTPMDWIFSTASSKCFFLASLAANLASVEAFSAVHCAFFCSCVCRIAEGDIFVVNPFWFLLLERVIDGTPSVDDSQRLILNTRCWGLKRGGY